MPTEYVESKELTNALTDFLGELEYTEFNPIRDTELKIQICLVVRQNAEGEDVPPKGDPVALKKVTPLERVYIDADYILTVDNYAWNHAKTKQEQDAMLHRGLMQIDIQSTEKGVKLKTRKPEIREFSATVGRFGAYHERLINFKDTFELAGKALVRQLGAGDPAGEEGEDK